eukprot:1247637-Rhodomonas_salina.1
MFSGAGAGFFAFTFGSGGSRPLGVRVLPLGPAGRCVVGGRFVAGRPGEVFLNCSSSAASVSEGSNLRVGCVCSTA